MDRLGLLGLFTLAASCFSPSSYTTPRTVEPGKVLSIVSLEGRNEELSPIDNTRAMTPLPSFTMRTGVHERIDIGVRFPLAGDVKLNFVRSRYFDAAIGPRVQWLPRQYLGADDGGGVRALRFVFDAPLLLAVHPAKELSVVLGAIPGVFRAADEPTVKWIAGTLGVDLRVGAAFALHPSVGVVRTLGTEPELRFFGGLGVAFGAIPAFE